MSHFQARGDRNAAHVMAGHVARSSIGAMHMGSIGTQMLLQELVNGGWLALLDAVTAKEPG